MNEVIKKNGIKFGVISGIISIVATVLMYAVDINLFANSYPWLLKIRSTKGPCR